MNDSVSFSAILILIHFNLVQCMSHARPGEFPWFAIVNCDVKDMKDVNIQCSGSLISATFILTSSLCVIEGNSNYCNVSLGLIEQDFLSNATQNGSFVVRSQTIYHHPCYEMDKYLYGIALVAIPSIEDRFSNLVKPINLLLANEKPSWYMDKVVTFLFMKTVSLEDQWLLRLNYVTMEIRPMAECMKIIDAPNDHISCATPADFKCLQSDFGGGPIIIDNNETVTQIGVYLPQNPCVTLKKEAPVFFVQVPSQADWISNTLLHHNESKKHNNSLVFNCSIEVVRFQVDDSILYDKDTNFTTHSKSHKIKITPLAQYMYIIWFFKM